jgi:hypothetical protein
MAVKVFVTPQDSLDYDNAQSVLVDRADGSLSLFTQQDGDGTLVTTYPKGNWHHVDITK